MMKKFSFLLGLMLFISACGKDSDKADPADPTPIVLKSPPTANLPLGLTSTTDDPNVVGLWQTECTPCGRSFCRQVLDISASNLQLRLEQFADKACSASQVHIRYFGAYSNAQRFIRSKLAQTHMKLVGALFQAAAENAQSCGFNSWPLDTWLDVTGHACPATPEKGGVWTEWTQPGKTILQAPYTIDGSSLTFTLTSGKVIYRRVP